MPDPIAGSEDLPGVGAMVAHRRHVVGLAVFSGVLVVFNGVLVVLATTVA